MRRKALEIKKKILDILKKEKELSLRELETKVNTNNKTIMAQIEELEFFDKIIVNQYSKNKKNGRPYTTVKLKYQ